ncbi:MAG: isoprenylcysteine carboxylmethyltransferase family protein [Cellulosilyticum sp.]|nr:isoprenylcysteine carboxylmethyltransferase family protein [Cellulosilyticum sp.]
MKEIIIQGITKIIAGIILIVVLLFLPAGTFDYWNAWLFMGLLFIPMILVGGILYFKAPELLKKRLNSKENEVEQKIVILWSVLLFMAGFMIAGLDYRFGWSNLPRAVIVLGGIIFLIAYGLYVEVMRENTYLSRTVEIQKGQKVIDKGLYGIVRHPMYFATILLFLSIPIILGSLVAFILFLVFYPIILAKRIKNEEYVLERGLSGYAEYKKRVRYRLFPFIW